METISSKDSKKRKNYIAFFDLDGTIISANSGEALIRFAYKKGYLTGLDLARGLYLALLYRLRLRDTFKIISSMLRWLNGISESAFVNLAEEIVRDQLLKAIRPEIVEEIMIHKKGGGMTVILSSAVMPVCKAIAHHLGMDDYICSSLQTKDGILTGNPEGSLCFGKEKFIRLAEYCVKNNTEPSDSWYYGDSAADLPVLSSVGNPVCVNPDKKLLKAARKRHWKILRLKKAG
jgi:HAD superfamily hydrolase (TIGR01490 family)